MEFIVRPAVASDADALGLVHVRSWRETYAHILSPHVLDSIRPEDRTTRWKQILTEQSGHQNFVAESGCELVGFSATGPGRDDDSPHPIELYSIYLLASWHGTGAGQALITTALGLEPAYLWVAELNPRARAFYRRNGFAADGTRKVGSFLGEDLAEIRMVR